MTMPATRAPRIDEAKGAKVADALARNTVFKVLSPARRQTLAECGSYVQLQRGDYLFRRGDASDAAYAIIVGEVEVTVIGLDGKRSVSRPPRDRYRDRRDGRARRFVAFGRRAGHAKVRTLSHRPELRDRCADGKTPTPRSRSWA